MYKLRYMMYSTLHVQVCTVRTCKHYCNQWYCSPYLNFESLVKYSGLLEQCQTESPSDRAIAAQGHEGTPLHTRHTVSTPTPTSPALPSTGGGGRGGSVVSLEGEVKSPSGQYE